MDDMKMTELAADACGGLGDTSACGGARRRGRPRAFDPEVVLQKVLEIFWQRGFSATSLDDLAEATGVSRPSLAAAFGDKEALYVKAMELYRNRIGEQLDVVLACTGCGDSVLNIMRRYFDVMIATYTGESESCLGCAFMSTAVNEAPRHESIMDMVQNALHGFDLRFQKFFADAQHYGCLKAGTDPKVLSQVVLGLTANIGMRARAGAGRAELKRIIDETTAYLFG